MKKHLLTLLLSSAVTASALAQGYAPFRMGHTPYFQAANTVYTLRINNSFAQGADSVFVFNPRTVPATTFVFPPGCQPFSFLKAVRLLDNLFGHKMIKTNQEYRFVFTTSDTFLLKPHAGVGEVWTFGQGVTATMQSKTTGIVQGQPDSVATIALSSGGTLQISKNYGLTSARSFYSYLNTTAPAAPLALVRLPEAGMGTPVNHPFRIYDFQPGDKFLYYGFEEGMGGMTCSESWTTSEVISRTDYAADSIVYELKEQKLVKTFGNPTAPSQFCPGTTATTLSPIQNKIFTVRAGMENFLQDLSREYRVQNPANYHMNTGMYLSQYSNRIGSSCEMLMQDTCAHAFIGMVDAESWTNYVEGLGKVRQFGISFGTSSWELIAYIKGSETYGNWAPLTSQEEELAANNPLLVFPNPFTNELTLQLPQESAGPAEVTVLNLQGQRVHQQQITDLGAQSGQKVALPSLPAGLYLLQVRQSDKSYSVKVQRK